MWWIYQIEMGKLVYQDPCNITCIASEGLQEVTLGSYLPNGTFSFMKNEMDIILPYDWFPVAKICTFSASLSASI